MEYEIKKQKKSNNAFNNTSGNTLSNTSVKPINNKEANSFGNQYNFNNTNDVKLNSNNIKPNNVSNNGISLNNNTQKTDFDLSKPKTNSIDKPFKSQYINNSGKWTQKAVNDNFVEFDDYIKDIQNETESYISFNNKPLKVNNDYIAYLNDDDKKITDDYTLKSDSYEIDDKKEPKLTACKSVDEIKEVLNETQKNIQRKVWRYGAENYLRKQRGFETSAWMLEHALQDNPSDIVRKNDSRIAYLINNDKNYLSALDNVISNSKNGVIDTKIEDVVFDEGDLYFSIHSADIYVKGYKQDDGKWLIYSQLEDMYDFTKIQTYMDKYPDFSFDHLKGTVANDTAVVSQKLGAINPYKVKVQFYTTR